MAGRWRKPCRGPLRGASDYGPHTLRRSRARARADPRPLAAGQRRRGTSSTAVCEAGIGKSRLVLVLRDRLGDGPEIRLESARPIISTSALYPVGEQLERSTSSSETIASDEARRAVTLSRPRNRPDWLSWRLCSRHCWPCRPEHIQPWPPEPRQRAAHLAGADVLDLRARRAAPVIARGCHWIDPTTRSSSTPSSRHRRRRSSCCSPPAPARAAVAGPCARDRGGPDRLVSRQAAISPARHARQSAARGPRRAIWQDRRRSAVRRGADQGGDRIGPARDAHRRVAGRCRSTSRRRCTTRSWRGSTVCPARIAAARRRARPRVHLRAGGRGGADGRTSLRGPGSAGRGAALSGRRAPAASYAFKHALVQDAAYGSLLKSRRRQHHQGVAEALEQQFPDIGQTAAGSAGAAFYRGGPGGSGDPLLAPRRRAGRWTLVPTWKPLLT